MKLTFIIALLLTVSAHGYSQSSQERFTVEAVSHYCYQDAADALEQAQQSAEKKAASSCGALGAERSSDWSLRFYGEHCRVTVRAEFCCLTSPQ